MINTIRNHKAEAAGILLGAIAGWCYWYFVGCASGTCPITSSPWRSTLYGALMGFLVSGILKKDKTNLNNKTAYNEPDRSTDQK